MPRGGTGTYALPAPPSPFVTGTTISAPDMMTVLQDIAAALTASLAADGQTPVTGNFDWGTHNITNIGSLAASAVAATNMTASSNMTGAAFYLTASGPTWTKGAGSPEGVVTAPIGSLYSRTDGSTGTSLYVKESGTGNTGWAAK